MRVFQIVVIVLCFQAQALFPQPARALREITVSGNGYERGLQHGKQLSKEIAEIIAKWKVNTAAALDRDADLVLAEFFEYADFAGAIQKWTPDLYDEVRGIADGSGQDFREVLVLNLLDEFWVFIDNLENHHCSALGVPAIGTRPSYVAQNMDLERYTDGYQVLMRVPGDDQHPEQLILTHPGLIALNGMNAAGVGVCVNTLMQLKASSSGLPVAFVVRELIRKTDEEDILGFIRRVDHASGQNYIIGIRDEVYDFEASANKVVRFNPENPNGTVYHTNHPLVNDDVKPWYAAYDPALSDERQPEPGNSHFRLEAVERRMAAGEAIDDKTIEDTLRSRDHQQHPVCRTNQEGSNAFTFASVIMTLSGSPNLQIVAGPPDEGEYSTYTLTVEKQDRQKKHPRARDLGIPFEGTPGSLNAITDVAGVEVGHTTLIEGEGDLVVGEGPVRTGVTAILPRGKTYDPVFAGWYSLNGNGEMTGTTWVEESGFLEGPVLITNTHSVGVVRDAVIAWQRTNGFYDPLFADVFWALPVVAETYDGGLNDINGFHVTREHVFAALDGAAPGMVAEGNVGGGTGMICHRFKGGIGSSSRRLAEEQGGYTVGALVQANYGGRDQLTIAGVPVGRIIEGHEAVFNYKKVDSGAGSIIAVIATDAPLLPHQLKRLARRVPMGIARLGGIGTNGSGDIFIAFSTANPGAAKRSGISDLKMLPNDAMNPLFLATIQATEEAIGNALIAAETMTGINGNTVFELPHEQLKDILRDYKRLDE
jgi:L-aminopeptidase/D-esterase-like protein